MNSTPVMITKGSKQIKQDMDVLNRLLHVLFFFFFFPLLGHIAFQSSSDLLSPSAFHLCPFTE